MAAAQSLNFCLYCQKLHQLIKSLIKHDFHIDLLSCRQFYLTDIASINKTNYISKQSHDTAAILSSVKYALRLVQLFFKAFKKLNI